MALLSSLTLENFRSFRRRTTFELAPLTIITGPNSSGKSSLLKALLFLSHNARLNRLHEPTFAGGDHNLGSLSSVRSRSSDGPLVMFGVGFDWGERDVWSYNYPALNRADIEWEDGRLDFEIGHVHIEVAYADHGDHVALRRLRLATGRQGKAPLIEVEADPVLESVTHELDEGSRQVDVSEGYQYRATLYGKWFFKDFEAAWEGLGIPHMNFGKAPPPDAFCDTFKDRLEGKEPDFDSEIEEAGLAALLLSRQLTFTFTVRDSRPLPLDRLIDHACNARKWDAREGFDPADNSYVRYALDLIFRPYLQRWVAYFQDKLADLDHAAPLRAKGQRVYADDDQDTFVRLLHEVATSPKNKSPNILFPGPDGKLRGLLMRFGLADGYTIERVADAGYAVNLIRGGQPFSLADLGYGYAQLLPLLIYAALDYETFPTLLVEEPETNLHPNLQARLADLFADLTGRLSEREPAARAHLLVETHSEYLIRRLQYLIAKKETDPERIAIYYLDPEAEDYIRRIEIDRYGQLSQEFGPGFFDEATNLMVDLFKYGSDN